ncbi:MAG: ribosomal protein [Verrucomicrobiota bacterium]|jgi:small subunit ribosomal protein S18
MQPKTPQRLINFRKANKRMPRRRLDIKIDKLNHKNPEYLAKFTTETGKILPRRLTGISAWMHRKITREIKRARAVNLAP